MSQILNDDVQQYIHNLIPTSRGVFAQMEEYALENKVPIISLPGANLLKLLVQIHNSKAILEVGTAIGYSTAWLASGIMGAGKVTTIEIDQARAEIAKDNLEKLDLTEKVDILVGDARDVLPSLNKNFDYIFIDAAKGQYGTYLQNSLPLLKDGGILVADNVLFRGMVAKEEVNKRYKTLVKGLRGFLTDLYNHPELDTVVLPIGDGISVSTKRKSF